MKKAASPAQPRQAQHTGAGASPGAGKSPKDAPVIARAVGNPVKAAAGPGTHSPLPAPDRARHAPLTHPPAQQKQQQQQQQQQPQQRVIDRGLKTGVVRPSSGARPGSAAPAATTHSSVAPKSPSPPQPLPPPPAAAAAVAATVDSSGTAHSGRPRRSKSPAGKDRPTRRSGRLMMASPSSSPAPAPLTSASAAAIRTGSPITGPRARGSAKMPVAPPSGLAMPPVSFAATTGGRPGVNHGYYRFSPVNKQGEGASANESVSSEVSRARSEPPAAPTELQPPQREISPAKHEASSLATPKHEPPPVKKEQRPAPAPAPAPPSNHRSPLSSGPTEAFYAAQLQSSLPITEVEEEEEDDDAADGEDEHRIAVERGAGPVDAARGTVLPSSYRDSSLPVPRSIVEDENVEEEEEEEGDEPHELADDSRSALAAPQRPADLSVDVATLPTRVVVAVRVRPQADVLAASRQHPPAAGAPTRSSAGRGQQQRCLNVYAKEKIIECMSIHPGADPLTQRPGLTSPTPPDGLSGVSNNNNNNSSASAAGGALSRQLELSADDTVPPVSSPKGPPLSPFTSNIASASAAAAGTGASSSAATAPLRFCFDSVLDEPTTQQEVFESIGRKVVMNSVLQGYHGTVLCYGQSGSGKTHTLLGPGGGIIALHREKAPAAAAAVRRGGGGGADDDAQIVDGEVVPIPASASHSAVENGSFDPTAAANRNVVLQRRRPHGGHPHHAHTHAHRALERSGVGEDGDRDNDNDNGHRSGGGARGQATTTAYSAQGHTYQFGANIGLLPRMLHLLFEALEQKKRDINEANDHDNAITAPATAAAEEHEGSAAAAAAAPSEPQLQRHFYFSVTISAMELYNEELRDLVPLPLRHGRASAETEPQDRTAAAAAESECGVAGDEHRDADGGESGAAKPRGSTARRGGSASARRTALSSPSPPIRPSSSTPSNVSPTVPNPNIISSSGGSAGGNNNSNANSSAFGGSARRLVIRDLGGKAENISVSVDNLKVHAVTGFAESMKVVTTALKERRMGATRLNINSSRSHTVFHVRVRQIEEQLGDVYDEDGHRNPDEQEVVSRAEKYSILTLVDLAGSERVSHTGAVGQRLEEAKSINLSLSLLGNVIRKLTVLSENQAAAEKHGGAAAATHIPFRDSKLTRLLKDSFGGNCVTYLLCNVSPDRRDLLESASTLRFAKLAKRVRNRPRANTSNRILQGTEEALHVASTENERLRRENGRLVEQLTSAQEYTAWLEDQLRRQAGHTASSAAAAAARANGRGTVDDDDDGDDATDSTGNMSGDEGAAGGVRSAHTSEREKLSAQCIELARTLHEERAAFLTARADWQVQAAQLSALRGELAARDERIRTLEGATSADAGDAAAHGREQRSGSVVQRVGTFLASHGFGNGAASDSGAAAAAPGSAAQQQRPYTSRLRTPIGGSFASRAGSVARPGEVLPSTAPATAADKGFLLSQDDDAQSSGAHHSRFEQFFNSFRLAVSIVRNDEERDYDRRDFESPRLSNANRNERHRVRGASRDEDVESSSFSDEGNNDLADDAHDDGSVVENLRDADV